MKRLYGIKKVEVANTINTGFHTLPFFFDNEKISVDGDWKQLKLYKPGSIEFNFSHLATVPVCNVTLQFNSFEKINGHNLFYKVTTTDGEILLVGLGEKYMTIPKTECQEVVGDNPSAGLSQKYTVTWKNDCGRIFAFS